MVLDAAYFTGHIFLSENILKKHYGIVGQQNLELGYWASQIFKGNLVFTNYTIGVALWSKITVKVDTVIL